MATDALVLKYRYHLKDARNRGISFLLTFEEWFKIWTDSGHLHERGPRRGQYVMARYGDKGPYAVGNVRIITGLENQAEQWARIEYRERMSAVHKDKEVSLETRQKIRIARTDTTASLETRQKMSATRMGNKNALGMKHTETARKKMSIAVRMYNARLRAEKAVSHWLLDASP